jgi:hypothetical protein
MFTATASPPSSFFVFVVHVLLAVCHIVSTTLSRYFSVLRTVSAGSAAWMAFIAPIVLRSIQGICTNPPIGVTGQSQMCSMAISAAIKLVLGFRPSNSHNAAQPWRRNAYLCLTTAHCGWYGWSFWKYFLFRLQLAKLFNFLFACLMVLITK